jgi:hypothetical protein
MMNRKGNEMNKMTTYVIYQLPFENENVRGLTFMSDKEIEEISDQYEIVARVDARSMDEVFRIANFVCDEDASLIEVVGEMHSLSVGDIVHNLETDETFVCANCGWNKIEMKESV